MAGFLSMKGGAGNYPALLLWVLTVSVVALIASAPTSTDGQALLGIAHGATTSYGLLSATIGKPAAVRALGSAVGRNPISVIVPCHRVLGYDGSLTGYAGGLERKTALLSLEGVPLVAIQKPDPLWPGTHQSSAQPASMAR